MRLLIAVMLLLAACGSPRRVVIEPDEVGGRKADTWQVTGEPAPATSAP
jgi:hypothetical protein